MRVIFANLWCLNPCVDRAVEGLLRHQPELIALAEVAPRQFDKVARRLSGYQPVLAVPTDRRCVLGLFSRLPVASAEVVTEGACRDRPYGKARLEGLAGCTAMIAHTSAPFTTATTARRDAQLECLAEDAAATIGALVLLGDLNADHSSPPLRRLAARARLHCPRAGSRRHATWPAPLPWRTFDHVLHRGEWVAEEFGSLHVRGSDHRAVFGSFRPVVPGTSGPPGAAASCHPAG